MRFFREWLVTGRPLAELRDVPLTSDDDLLRAQATYSINHLRTLASSLPATVAAARQAINEALADQQREQEGESKFANWRPADTFWGRTFTDAGEVNDAFDEARKEVLAHLDQGKTVKVV
jgi:hypothetical protein